MAEAGLNGASQFTAIVDTLRDRGWETRTRPDRRCRLLFCMLARYQRVILRKTVPATRRSQAPM